MSQPKSRIPLAIGLTAAGAAGYYLYSAGGNPRVAEKKFEHDVSSASSSFRGDSSGKEVQKKGEELAHRAGAVVDSTVGDVKAKLDIADAKIGAKASEADAKLHQLAHDGKKQLDQASRETARELKETADKFDKTVERKAAEAKSGLSSWFGFGK